MSSLVSSLMASLAVRGLQLPGNRGGIVCVATAAHC